MSPHGTGGRGPGESARRRRARSWLRNLGLALGLAYAVYLLIGNLLLNTPLGPALANRQPEKFHVDWGHGYTLWPGRARLWDIELGGRVARTAWTLEVDAAAGRVRLLPLLRRRLEVPWVEAGGVDARVERLPEALARAEPRPGAWTLRFERVAASEVRSARLGGLVLSGQGTVETGFEKQLRGGALEVMPSHAHFSDARLDRVEVGLLAGATLDMRFAMGRHRRADAAGTDALRLTRGALQLEGKTPGLSLRLQEGQSGVDTRLVAEEGRASADLAWAEGALLPGGQARIDVPVHSTGFDGIRHENRLQVHLDVDEGVRLEAATRAPVEGADAPDLSLDARLDIDGRALPLASIDALLARTSGHVQGRWAFPSLAWLEAFLPQAAWLGIDGEGLVDADIRVVEGRVAADSRVDVPRVKASATVMGNRIDGQARLEARLAEDADGALVPRLALHMDAFRVADAVAPDRPYVEGNALELEVDSGIPIGSVRQSGAAAALQQARQEVKARLRFEGARVPDLRAYNGFLPGTQLRFDGGSGTLGGDLRLDTEGVIDSGWLRIRATRARLHIAELAMGADVDLRARLARNDAVAHEFKLDGSTLHLANVSYTEPSGDSIRGWWAKVAFDDARIDWKRPMDVSGRARIAMRDVSLLLSLYSRQRDYPGWITRVVGSGQAQVTGRLAWKGDTLVFDQLHADNGRYELRARLRLQGKQRSGSLYAKWGVLDCAVELHNGTRRFHLVRSRRWYDAQPALLP